MSGIDHIAGETYHGRRGAVKNAFRYSIDYVFLDADEEVLVDHGVMVSNAIGSPGFERDPDEQREWVRANVRRSTYPEGLTRQMAAIIDDGDRTSRLASVTAPTLVLHGEDDPLVKVEGGRATASAIPGAQIKTWAGWGHDLPAQMIEPIADSIAAHAQSAG